MTRPRKALISLEATPYYHIVSRCVRRSFLCGVDHTSGRDYEHRRQWIVDRVRLLSSLFAIDIAAYAVMSNHYHLVVKLCPEQLDDLSDNTIIDRWCTLFKGPLLIQRLRNGETLASAERTTINDIVAVWRKKLADISWFMRCLNQPIARQANEEDQCTGHFWEGRFKSQALTTEEALLSCMAYVDLNPVRAGLAPTPETSDHTSIQERIQPRFDMTRAIQAQYQEGEIFNKDLTLKPLLHFDGTITKHAQSGTPFPFDAYLSLVDWTGRSIRKDKRGAIPSALSPILQRFDVSPQQWFINTTQFEAIHSSRFSSRCPTADTG